MTDTSDCSLGYWEQPSDNKGMGVVAPIGISEAEFETYAQAIGAYKAVTERRLYSLLNRNWNRLRSMRDLYANLEQVGGSFRHVDRNVLSVSFMGEIVNWLAVTRLYLENDKNFLIRYFGEESESYQRYVDLTHEVFDLNPSYRFLYNLRDYSQHFGPPLGGVTVSASGAPERRSLELFVSRSELLQASFNWNRHAKKLLEGWPEQILLLPLVEEAMGGFRSIEECVTRALIDRCIEVGPVLREGIERVGDTSGFPAIFRFQGSDEVHMSFQSFPRVVDLDRLRQLASSEDQAEPQNVAGDPVLERTPALDHAESRAIAVIASWLEHGPGERLDEMVNEVINEDQGIDSLVSGLINLSAYSLMTLAKAIGGTAQSILGGFVPRNDSS